MFRNRYEIKQEDVYSINPPTLSPPCTIFEKDSNLSSSSSSSSLNRISPVILLAIIILSVMLFISGLLHLLVRYLTKRSHFSPIYHSNRYPETARSQSLERQLQQLFRQHDSGLDQAVIDELPVFYYKGIMGLKEPLDCAVCLYDFSHEDKLRLLPICSHAFHIDCIDTWLLSNSTCPLCRSTLRRSTQNPVPSSSHGDGNGSCTGPKTGNIVVEKRVFSVRLGKHRSSNGGASGEEETGGRNMDGRRCYSMGRVEYVVGDSNLQVELCHDITVTVGGDNELPDKKITGRTRGDSFSVSKIWLWSNKNRFPSSTIDMCSSVNVS